jgi:predicted nucleotide-binding protein
MDLSRYQTLVAQGRSLLAYRGSEYEAHDAFHMWSAQVANWLDDEVPVSGLSAEWSGLESSNIVVGTGYDPSLEGWARFRNAVQHRLMWLSGLLRMTNDSSSSAPGKKSSPIPRVFVVHGRNDELREQVARLLGKLGLEPIILHEQPNRGRTILEKFVDYSDVGFAVVILTGDDSCKLRDDSGPATSRARQNVIFELGFFIGKLGREYVAALYEEGVELPSDYQGILFTPLDDAGAWKYIIARELKDAGLTVDLNRVS